MDITMHAAIRHCYIRHSICKKYCCSSVFAHTWPANHCRIFVIDRCVVPMQLWGLTQRTTYLDLHPCLRQTAHHHLELLAPHLLLLSWTIALVLYMPRSTAFGWLVKLQLAILVGLTLAEMRTVCCFIMPLPRQRPSSMISLARRTSYYKNCCCIQHVEALTSKLPWCWHNRWWKLIGAPNGQPSVVAMQLH